MRPAQLDAFDFAPADLPLVAALDTTLERARACISPVTGTLEALPEGGVLLRFWSHSLDWAASYLADLGCRFTILQPPELRDAVRHVAEHLLETVDEPTCCE